jgi:hypothetical protein
MQQIAGWLEKLGLSEYAQRFASLQTRVGIATGLVVVGDLIGSGDTQERSWLARHRTLRTP